MGRAPTDLFTHSSIGANQIRLLKPVLGASEKDLKFTLSCFTRARVPSYTAVSYAWETERPTEVIHLNGQRFYIRLNLWSCLFYLSRYASTEGWSHIWVDAICIDQANASEQSAQVRLMSNTYRDAECVYVWLELVSAAGQYRSSWPEPTRTSDDEGFSWHEYMADLAHRPYWSRLWVIQEFLTGRDVQLYCSGNRIDWLEFKSILQYRVDVDLFNSATDITTTTSYSALPLITGRHPDKHPETLEPLHDLLIRHCRSMCSNPRDRVFALLSLIEQDERAFLERCFPDYTLSEVNVVVIALAHLLYFYGSEITPSSEEIFLGLGVESKAQRARLLKRAANVDYFGDFVTQNLLDILEQSASVEDSDLPLPWEVNTSEGRGTRTIRRGIGWLILGLFIGAVMYTLLCKVPFALHR